VSAPHAFIRFILGVTLLGLATAVPARAAGDELAEAWRFVAGHLYAEAGTKLRTADDTRERRLAEAVLLAAQQPTTDERMQEVERRLNALAAATDDVSNAALYLAGRLHQVHYPRPDNARAAEYFERLAERSPASHWAQLGLVKLALLQLYVLPETGGPGARLAKAEALLPRVTIPQLRRDLLITLGRTRIFYDQPLDTVLTDLLAADAIGGLTGPAQGEFYLQIGELSFRAGQLQQSRDYFTRYLKLNTADPRAYTATRRIQEIDARFAAGGEELP
jgi:tetratricopeptide (TPR) repeat protein